jgi:dipeptidyl-peptidase-4
MISNSARPTGHVIWQGLRLTRLGAACAILATAVLAAPVSAPIRAQGNPETKQLFRRLFASEDFIAKTFGPARWLGAGDAYTTLEDSVAVPGAKDIVRYGAAGGERSILVSASQLIPAHAKEPLAIEDYVWSRDMQRLLIFTNSKRVWRQNTRGDYWVLDRTSAVLRRLGGNAPSSTLMFAKFSPDGSKAAYVRENNLFAEDVTSGAIVTLTQDGSATTINGTSDWVYEEELDLRDGFRWSPDGREIAYWQFDATGVGTYPLLYNLGAPGEIVTGFPYPGLGRYPTRVDLPYPIAGSTNSAARVGVVSVAGGKTRWIDVPGNPRENYIARMEWVPAAAHELVIEHLNRLQNQNEVLLADSGSGGVKRIFLDRDDAWVDYVPEFTWVAGGNEFLWLSERSGWRQAFRVSREGKVQPITHGAFDVISFSGLDEKAGFLYFVASPENATQRYLYRARLDGSGEAERVTPRNTGGTNRYDVSPNGYWAFHTHSSADVPPGVELVQLPAHTASRTLVENSALRAAAAPFLATASSEFFQLDVGDGITFDGRMFKPANFDAAKKYPVLVYVYGEPFLQMVLDEWFDEFWYRWNFSFNRAVAARGYIVVCIDNRGTPAPKGRAWRKIVYGAIHPVIVADQTAALQTLLRTRPYLDASRTAVWGWSGGGSSTLNLMFRSPGVYKTGMAVAPVPELRLYDTIYEERYMGLPQQNVDGYKRSSAINFAEGLEGHLLIVHGSGDDNVHYSGTELLVNRLIELGKPFDFMEYPNRSHSIIEGQNTTYHLFSLLLRYLEEHVTPGPMPR